MSTVKIADVEHQVIIVRRPHDDHDEGHHGGVWKIAFADFMTAMMCFFLVMWLISAADEKTKAAVANYFNPVKLMDRNSSRKGLESIGDGPNAVGLTAETPQDSNGAGGVDGRGNAGPSTNQHSAASADAEKRSDDHLFADPYAVLAEIAANSGVRQNVSDKGDGGMQQSGPATGASGGESYRDPFAPDFWSQQVAAPLAAEASAERPKPKNDAAAKQEPEVAERREEAELRADPTKAEKIDPEPAKPIERQPEETGPSEASTRTAEQLAGDLAKAFAEGDKLHEGISVTATDKGVIISITDQFDFGMFEIGSAVPRRELVLAMEKIGQALNAQNGKITISGHTDARPFRNETYDNWRLSSARAHSAYYMLVRAGLDERRVTEVSGFADRKLKDDADPMAAANRRIEILLEAGQ